MKRVLNKKCKEKNMRNCNSKRKKNEEKWKSNIILRVEKIVLTWKI